MKKIKFFIQGPLPGLNEIIKASKQEVKYLRRGKRRVFEYTRMKKKWNERCYYALIRQNPDVSPFKHPIFIEFHWIEKHARRDPDNVAAGRKFIIDSIVLAELIPDDSQKWVAGFSDQFFIIDKDKKLKPGVLVIVHEYK
jgi:hypothetical protein